MTTSVSPKGDVEGGGLKFEVFASTLPVAVRAQEENVVTQHDMEIVNAVKLAVADHVGTERFELWFRGADFRIAQSSLTIATRSAFTLSWIKSNLRREIEVACRSVLGDNALIEYLVDEQLNACVVASDPVNCGNPQSGDAERHHPRDTKGLQGARAGGLATGPMAALSCGTVSGPSTPVGSNGSQTDAAIAMSPRITQVPPSRKRKFAQLASFVAGESNRVALSSAQHVASQLGSVSPLFLYGATGTGKSHLAEGIWSQVRRSPGGPRTVFLSAEQFTTYFLQALNGSGLPSFRRRYRQVDLLVIDDIQFFGGKRATISELQYTIDAVAREGGQLVLTADRSPSELTELGREMIARLAGGLVIRVEPPDRISRVEILEREARRRGLRIPPDVQELIADRIVGDVRQLLGALNRLHASRLAWNREIDREMAAQSLADVFRASVRVVRLEDIESAVCGVFDVASGTLRSSSKSRKNSQPRMLAMWLARKYTRAGLVEIGDYFGRRSHATVISAARKVAGWVDEGASVRMTDQECPVLEAIRQVERRLLG